jgi:hypothetical protein
MNPKSDIEAAQIRAKLNFAGEVLPASLREEAYGTADDIDAPYLVVESAEGVTTFPGVDEENGESEAADEWFGARYAEIEKEIPEPTGRRIWPFGNR